MTDHAPIVKKSVFLFLISHPFLPVAVSSKCQGDTGGGSPSGAPCPPGKGLFASESHKCSKLLWPNTNFTCLIIALVLFQTVKTPGSISHMKNLAASLHSLDHSWKGKDTLCWIFFSLSPDIGIFWWICSQFCPFTCDYSAFFTDDFGQGAGLDDPSGCLPNGDILWFYVACNQNVQIPLMSLAGNPTHWGVSGLIWWDFVMSTSH